MLKQWKDLPDFMRTPEVRPYWEILNRKRGQLFVKRVFDLAAAIILVLILFLPMLVIAIAIKLDSNGPIFYRQERVTSYGRSFHIHKFRTMVANADRVGSAITVSHDNRITRVGSKLRRLRLDELPQVVDVIEGTMSFVGTRPEVVKYVEKYRPEFYATLLMPAGITSEASIRYKDEDRLLDEAAHVDEAYVTQILPSKMEWNLESIRHFGILRDILTMLRTITVVLGRKV